MATKHGTRREHLAALEAAHAAGLRVYADVVLNHKVGGDHEEEFRATPYNPDRHKVAMSDLQTIRTWTHFAFPGRGGRHSDMQWHCWHFREKRARLDNQAPIWQTSQIMLRSV